MSDVRHMFPAFRVFVFGVEVTDDVLSVSVTHSDSRGPSTAEIVLANKDATRGIEDRYVITEKDIQAMVFRDQPAAVNEVILPLRQVYERAMTSTAGDLSAFEGFGRLSQAAQPFTNVLGVVTAVGANRERTAIDAKLKHLSDSAQESLRRETVSAVEDVRRQVLENLENVVTDPRKYSVLKTKVGEVTEIGNAVLQDDTTKKRLYPFGTDDGLIDTLNEVAAMGGMASRYPYQVGDCIFHSNDPVRIFYRDPRSSDWYHLFAGFVSDTTDDIDANNAKTVTIRCEDALRSLRYARLTTSPGIIDIEAAATDVDTVLRTFFSDDFTDLSLFQLLFTLVFGFDQTGTTSVARRQDIDLSSVTGTVNKRLVSANGTKDVQIKRDGVGLHSFSRSLICLLSRDRNVDLVSLSGNVDDVLAQKAFVLSNLAQYQAIVDHQVRVTDLTSMVVDGETPLTVDRYSENGQPSLDAVIKLIGEHPELYPVDGGRLIMLAPAALGERRPATVLYKGYKGVELKTGSMTSRLQKIYDVLERIEFSFYATPKGDLIAEMPLHDFDPADFGGTVSHEDLVQTFRANDRDGLILDGAFAQLVVPSGHSMGPFDASYLIARKDTCSYSRSFADENVRTLATCSWSPLEGFSEFGTAVETTGQLPARRLIPSLIPLFGVRHEEVPPTIIARKDNADILCQFLLNRFNGGARSVSIDALPLLRMMPNRPVLIEVRSCVATCREVTQTISWPTDMSMQLKLDYVRGWDGNTDATTKRPYYSYLGGFRANPVNYAVIFRKQTPTTSMAEPDAPNAASDTELLYPIDGGR